MLIYGNSDVGKCLADAVEKGTMKPLTGDEIVEYLIPYVDPSVRGTMTLLPTEPPSSSSVSRVTLPSAPTWTSFILPDKSNRRPGRQ